MNRPDENAERGNWSGKFDFILSCIGYAVGLGNVWRFPFLAYRNGGGAFYIPYWIMLIFIGMPILMLEMSLGQFASLSSAKAWRFSRLFVGIGLAQAIVSFLVAIYYNMIIAWASYYLFASFTALPGLPWDECKDPWAGPFCLDRINLTWSKMNHTMADCTAMNYTAASDGWCYVDTNMTDPYGFYNYTAAIDAKKELVVPTEDYLNNEVLKKSASIAETGTPDWKLALALLFAWIIIFLCMIRGIKSSGKVVYFTATFPYVILLILLVRGLLLDGFKEGLLFYVEPKIDRLGDIQVWRDAAVQLFFSLSASWGGLITLSSYNRFHNNSLRDVLIVALADTLTSMFAGCVIFSYIGFLSKELGVEIESVFAGGSTLAFQVYPYAVTLMPVSPLWAILFFFMLIILGMDSQFVLVETVLSSFLDVWPRQLRSKKTLVLLVMCVVMYLLGLTLTCPGGVYWLDLLDTYSGGWNLMFISVLECIAICYVYGFSRFTNDIRIMIGDTPCCPWSCCKWWWLPMWGFITPVGVVCLIVYTWIKWKRNMDQPIWYDVIGWLILMGVIVSVIIVGIVMVITAPGRGCGEKLKNSVTPPADWGPALVEHRQLVTYVPGFVVDPYGEKAHQMDYEKGEANPGFAQF